MQELHGQLHGCEGVDWQGQMDASMVKAGVAPAGREGPSQPPPGAPLPVRPASTGLGRRYAHCLLTRQADEQLWGGCGEAVGRLWGMGRHVGPIVSPEIPRDVDLHHPSAHNAASNTAAITLYPSTYLHHMTPLPLLYHLLSPPSCQPASAPIIPPSQHTSITLTVPA